MSRERRAVLSRAASGHAVVVGSGPNGLAAAVTLARAGLRVTVYERSSTLGGGASSAELTLRGFVHDVCSAVHPLAFESEFFRQFGLRQRVPFVVPEASFGHPLDGGRAAVAYRNLNRTRESLGVDGRAYAALIGPLARRAREVAEFTGSTLVRVPPSITTAALFGAATLEQGSPLWNARFREDLAPALLTGAAAHSILPLPSLPAAGAGLALTAYAHAQGWPIPVGGTQAIADALVADIQAHGGRVVTNHEVTSLDEFAAADVIVLDVTPRALVSLAGPRMPAKYRRALQRFRYGNAVAKLDFALSDPVPWQSDELRAAGTLHLGGTRAEIAASENAIGRGLLPESPYVLASQPTVFDPSRAPHGKHTLWAYTHVPAGSTADRLEAVTAQIERFAPGFRDTILATSSRTAPQLAGYNPNYIGGDISAGEPNLRQLLQRPVISREPWRTPMPGVYLASSSVSPGPGVHGLAGWHAARSALRHEFGAAAPDLAPR